MKTSNLMSHVLTLGVAAVGLFLILVSNAFSLTILKVQVDRVSAEVGSLLLTVGILQWFFEFRLRREMFSEISASVLGNRRLFESGIFDWRRNSKEVQEGIHWAAAAELIIGVQYSPRFLEDHYDMIRDRVSKKRRTIILVLDPDCAGAKWLKETGTGFGNVRDGVERIESIVREIGEERGLLEVARHERILRYSFIATEEIVWVKFFTNGPQRATVPAFAVRAGSPLFEFFKADIHGLREAALMSTSETPKSADRRADYHE